MGLRVASSPEGKNVALSDRALWRRKNMKRAAFVLALLSLLNPLWAEEPVYLPDAELKTAVEDELWITDPTPTDMLELLSLRATDQQISSLAGLEYATNIQELDVCHNYINDITPLAGLTNLRKLVLNHNHIRDISALSGLVNLEHLDIHDNFHISDISVLSGMSGLQTVILRGNAISDISVFSALTDLQTLYIENNDISDISVLTALTTLTDLDLRDNPLSEEAIEIHIPQIIANNPGIRIRPAIGPFQLVVSSGAGGSVTNPGEGTFTYEYGEIVFLTAEADPGFLFDGWSGTTGGSQNPMCFRVEGDEQIHAWFRSTANVMYVDDNAPNDPVIGNTRRSDPEENGTPEHPFDSIQEAIDVAADGATVVVHPGTYHENITLLGKSIHLTGIDPNGAPWPVIDGTSAGPVVSFLSSEDPNCTVVGFVITGGNGEEAGAVLCSQSSPTVANCLIVGNRATEPQAAAVYCKNSHAVFDNCTLADNVGGPQGAGLTLVDSDVVLSNSIVWGNTPNQIVLSGDSVPSIVYSDIAGGWLDLGNIEADPRFACRGYWADPADPNVAVGSSNADAIWVQGDYHLKSQAGRWDGKTQVWVQDDVTSPCIDTGDPAVPVGSEPVPNGDIVNLGACGGTVHASKSY